MSDPGGSISVATLKQIHQRMVQRSLQEDRKFKFDDFSRRPHTQPSRFRDPRYYTYQEAKIKFFPRKLVPVAPKYDAHPSSNYLPQYELSGGTAQELKDLYDEGLLQVQDILTDIAIPANPPYLVTSIQCNGKQEPFSLMDHQRQAIGLYRKTLQTISIMMEDKNMRNLIVAPNLLIGENWLNEIEKFFKGNTRDGPSVLLYHSKGKKGQTEETLVDFDIVIATLSEVANQFSTFSKYMRNHIVRTRSMRSDGFTAELSLRARRWKWGESKDFITRATELAEKTEFTEKLVRGEWSLANVSWNILAIDEVHHAREWGTRNFHALSDLKAKFVIAISGTRLQNRYSDLFPICSLIRLKPLDDMALFRRLYMAKVLGEGGRGPGEKVDPLSHIGQKFEILGVILKARGMNRARNDAFNFKPVTNLRKRKREVVQCPLDDGKRFDKWWLFGQRDPEPWIQTEQDTQLETIQFWGTEADKQQYNERIQARSIVTDPKKMGGRAAVALLRARLAAVHPAASYASGNAINYAGAAANDPDETVDDKAEDRPPDARKGHYKAWQRELRIVNGRWRSARMEEVVNITAALMREEDPLRQGNLLVFSYSISVLELADVAFREQFPTVHVGWIDGHTPEIDRKAAAAHFQDPAKGFQILLCSSKVIDEGIILTNGASVIEIFGDWNPFASDRGAARVDRIGNNKQVVSYHLEAPQSIDRMVTTHQGIKRTKGSYFNGQKDLPMNRLRTSKLQ